MRKVNATVLVFALFAIAVPLFGDQPDPMLRQLDYLTGTFQCSGIAFANPMAPEHPTRAEVTAKWAMGGYWVPFTYTETKTAENPMPFMVSGFMGYDPQAKQLVMAGVDSAGGYSTASSSGWDGDRLVFNGPWHMPTMTVKARDTFVKKGEGKFTHIGELEMDGKWVKLGEENCTRK